MKTLIIITAILMASVCYANDPNTIDPNSMVSITLTMPQEEFDTMFSYITYYAPMPQLTDPNGLMVDVYEPTEYIKYILVNYLDKIELRGRKRKGGDDAVKSRDRAKVARFKKMNVKAKLEQE